LERAGQSKFWQPDLVVPRDGANHDGSIQVASTHVSLVALLMAMVAVFPLVERSGPGRCLLNLLVLAGIVAAVQHVQAPRRGVFAIAVFGVVAVVCQVLHQAGMPQPIGLVSALAQTAFYTGAAALMSMYMLRDTHASVDELYAAAAAFMLLALAWAMAYWCIEYLDPAAFSIVYPSHADRGTWFEFFYFSMTTLSTTGFGDVAPATSGARAAVILEQFVGVMYVALVIARLAGLAGRRRLETQPDR
jgi:hypothetical protein